jgi:hypothetical protein
MWEVENRSPFPHRSGFLRDHLARTFWCLHLKATFALRGDHSLQCLLPQPDLLQGPAYDGNRLLADGETGHERTLCDLIIQGTATAPADATPQKGWQIEASLPGWRKALQVLPARQWRGRRAQLTDTPLAPVALDWRDTFGGEGVAENPCGLGHTPADGQALPRLAPAGTSPGATRFAADCLAPVPREWPQRAKWGGVYDAAWQQRRAPLLPADLDPRYWQSALPDQWVMPDTLPGAVLNLVGFGPKPRAITLPDCEFEVATRFRGTWHPQTPRLQSVTVDLDAQRLAMVWLAVLPIEATQNDVLVERSFIALQKGRGFTVPAADMPAFMTPWETA